MPFAAPQVRAVERPSEASKPGSPTGRGCRPRAASSRAGRPSSTSLPRSEPQTRTRRFGIPSGKCSNSRKTHIMQDTSCSRHITNHDVRRRTTVIIRRSKSGSFPDAGHGQPRRAADGSRPSLWEGTEGSLLVRSKKCSLPLRHRLAHRKEHATGDKDTEHDRKVLLAGAVDEDLHLGGGGEASIVA